MNIFATSYDPYDCARVLDDKRLVKMCLETGQILSTALSNLNSWASNLYKPTHTRHPCILWAGASRRNFDWTVQHGLALADEYRFRFSRHHKSGEVIRLCRDRFRTVPLDRVSFDPFVNCTPYKDLPVMKAYREYLTKDKWGLPSKERWTKRSKPDWSKS